MCAFANSSITERHPSTRRPLWNFSRFQSLFRDIHRSLLSFFLLLLFTIASRRIFFFFFSGDAPIDSGMLSPRSRFCSWTTGACLGMEIGFRKKEKRYPITLRRSIIYPLRERESRMMSVSRLEVDYAA